jgi:hypothetical protein
MFEWVDYIDDKWTKHRSLFELILQQVDSEQWVELAEIPSDVEKVLQKLCRDIFPIKTKSVEYIELILEHSIVASINSQLLFLTTHFQFCVSNAVYSCFNRIHSSPVFKNLIEEYRIIWMSLRRIQFCWRRCIANPTYNMCLNRLLREHGEHITWIQTACRSSCVQDRTQERGQ